MNITGPCMHLCMCTLKVFTDNRVQSTHFLEPIESGEILKIHVAAASENAKQNVGA